MAIKAIIEKLEDAPEALREHYVAGTKEAGTEGKFVLGVDAVGGFALEDVGGLKSALGKERSRADKAEGSLTKFKDLDPDTVRAQIAKLAELEGLDPSKEADKLAQTKIDAAIKQITTKHDATLGERDARISLLSGHVERLMVDSVATAALAEAKGSIELLLPHVKNAARVREVDGKFKVEMVDGEGNVVLDGRGEPVSIKDYVADMRKNEAYARAFEGDGQTGTGKQQDHGSGNSGKGKVDGTRQERGAHYAAKFGLPES